MELSLAPQNELALLDGLNTIPQPNVWLTNKRSRQTRKSYYRGIKDFIAFIGIQSEKDFCKVNQAHVIAWREKLIKEGKKPNTVNSKLATLSSLYKFLFGKQVVDRNPVDGVERLRINKEQVKTPAITAQEVRKILDAPDYTTLQGLRDATILHIFFYTGQRIAEICNLKVSDYYIDRGYRVLRFTIKGGKENVIAINHELKNILNRYLKQSGHGEEKNSPLILAIKQGELRNHLTPKHVNQVFHKYTKLSELPDNITPHSARATFITTSLENGCPIDAVQQTVGHSRISTTQMYDKRALNHRESASHAVRF